MTFYRCDRCRAEMRTCWESEPLGIHEQDSGKAISVPCYGVDSYTGAPVISTKRLQLCRRCIQMLTENVDEFLSKK